MQASAVHFRQDIYVKHLAIIDGVKFTPREIDIIACLLNARRTNQIAFILSIAPRTVTTHFRNIMLRLDCNSQDGIISFIEKSHKLSILRNYYSNLLVELAFEKTLKEISKRKYEIIPGCLIVYWQDQTLKNSLIHNLNGHLLQTGLSTEIREQELSQKIETLENSPNTLIILIKKEDQDKSSVTFSNFPSVDLSEQKNYFFSVLEILKRILKKSDLGKTASDFHAKYESIGNNSLSGTSQSFSEVKDLRKKSHFRDNIIESIFRDKIWTLRDYFLIMVCLISVFMISQGEKKQTNIFTHALSNIEQQTTLPSIRSDLIIPTEEVRLYRPEIIRQMDDKLKRQECIVHVALVGPGGTGKTTLAREYARQQNIPIVWEINAETKLSLINSFEALAYALAKKEEDQKILRELHEIKNPQEKETKVLLFVKEHLRSSSKWLLIFDNVEQFSDIKNHFPSDQTVWGIGKVILTTRDNNIQNNNYINYIIPIRELSTKEKLALFTKIHKTWSIKVQKTYSFLKEIPPYPLDISTAAYYLKDTGTSYENYLDRMNETSQNFERSKENLLSEISDYTKTRYGIITLSLKKLLEEHPDFKELLLFISLLDSQNIPKELLASCKDSTIVDQLIHSLRKHSLITSEMPQTIISPATLSIHRSTQVIMLAYLTEKLDLKINQKLLEKIATAFENYMSDVIETDDCWKMKLVIPHAKTFLNYDYLNSYKVKSSINILLGFIQYYFGDNAKAKALLLEGLTSLKKSNLNDNIRMFELLAYLGKVYRLLGDYTKASSIAKECSLLYNKCYLEKQIGLARALSYLGTLSGEIGNFEESIKFLEHSFQIYEKYFPTNYAGIARNLRYLGVIYKDLGNYHKSKDLFEKSVAVYKKHFPKNHTGLARSLGYLGNAYIALNDYANGKKFLEESLIIYKEHFPENHVYVGWVLEYLGVVHSKLGDYKRAKSFLENTIKIYKRHYGANHIETAHALRDLGYVYFLEGRLEDAENFFVKSLNAFKNHNHPQIYLSLEKLSELYLTKSTRNMEQGYVTKANILQQKALNFLKQALNIVKTKFPDNSPHIARIKMKLQDESKPF